MLTKPNHSHHGDAHGRPVRGDRNSVMVAGTRSTRGLVSPAIASSARSAMPSYAQVAAGAKYPKPYFCDGHLVPVCQDYDSEEDHAQALRGKAWRAPTRMPTMPHRAPKDYWARGDASPHKPRRRQQGNQFKSARGQAKPVHFQGKSL